MDWPGEELLASKVASRVYSVVMPKPDPTGVAAVSTAGSVGGSVSAASPMPVNMNALECTCETVISKASGPHDCEAYNHANCETTTPIGTGAAAGSLSGRRTGGPSIVVPNTLLSHPEAEAYRHSHVTVAAVMSAPVSSA